MSEEPYQNEIGEKPMCTQMIMNQLEDTIEEMQGSQDSSELNLLKPMQVDKFKTK